MLERKILYVKIPLFKAEKGMKLKETLRGLRRDKSGIKERELLLEHQQTVDPRARVGRGLLVYLLIFSFKLYLSSFIKPSKFLISINFTNPLRKTFFSQVYPRITQSFTNTPKRRII